ncbi:MAG: DUF4822 domain-containing protein [Candidatus Peribacteria bacterium]|jgi:hypothetical protein|nr:DUF4822 domain-containing protein [Candidatus Peribacteria bacterium]
MRDFCNGKYGGKTVYCNQIYSLIKKMLLVKIGDVDYTEYVKLPTLSRTQQLNNRSDTLKFSAFKNRPLEQQRIDIWEYTRLAQDADGGDIEIFVEELFTESKKLMKGMEIRF